MREGISVTAIFPIVILFILLFAAIMAMTINNSNAFGVKDEILTAIESLNGANILDTNGNLSERIVEPMKEASYRISGVCPKIESDNLEDVYKGFNRDGRAVGENERAAVCIRKVNATNGIDDYYNKKYNLGKKVIATDDFPKGYYYQVIVFYQLDMPIINQMYNFQIKGETKIFYEYR